MAEQRADPVSDTPVEEPQKKSRAGRNLPAAIGVGVLLGGMAIGALLFWPIGWLPILAVFIPIATHEVIRRLREAGYALPMIPLSARRAGHDLADVLRPDRGLGRLRRDDRRLHGLAAGRAGHQRGAGQLPARHLGHRASRHVGAAVRELQRAADLPGPRWRPDVHGDRDRRVRRHRRIHRRGVVRQAPDGARDQPEEIVGGAGRLAALRRHGGGAVSDVPDGQARMGRACRSG